MDDDDEEDSPGKPVHLPNSDSEFTLVIGDRSKLSTEFGLKCISTLDELNDRIANLSNRKGFSPIDDDILDHESDEKKLDGKPICINESTTRALPKQAAVHSSTKRPLLVELHFFPGFDDNDNTPSLPGNLEADFILKKITNAKLDLRKKPTFKKVFREFFHSLNSQGILRDSFWWYFCHKYEQSKKVQEELFDRIARNYTNLLVTWTGSKYQDKLFKDYADLMSQAVYSTFCHAFPTSYRQFNADFRDEVLFLINLWMMGTRPAPRTWDKWNFEGIEPNGLRKGGMIKEDSEEKNTSRSQNPSIGVSEHILSAVPEQVRTRLMLEGGGSLRGSRELLGHRRASLFTENGSKKGSAVFDGSRRNSVIPGGTRLGPNASDILRPGALTPECVKPLTPNISRRGSLSSPKTSGLFSHANLRRQSKNQTSVVNIMQHLSSVLGIAEKTERRDSCAADSGPRFQKVVFNLHGRSPLVEHFLSKHRLSKDAGTSVLVQRTEIETLPPFGAETYDDVIRKVKKTSERLRTGYNDSTSTQRQEHTDRMREHAKNCRHFNDRARRLLSNPSQVRKVSELLRASNDKEDQTDTDDQLEASKLKALIIQAVQGGNMDDIV